jgi:hypothetical protein
MHTGGEPSTNELVDLLVGRPGWRLEPRSTPGTTPLWCFVANGKIEFSVTVEAEADTGSSADAGSLHLYVMETDQEIIFKDADALMAWLRANRAEAALDQEQPGQGPKRKSRFRRITEWG